MYSVIQSKPVEVFFDEIPVYIHQSILDSHFITSLVSDRFIIDHRYTFELCNGRANEATISAIVAGLYGDYSKVTTEVQEDIYVEFVNLYIMPDKQKNMYMKLDVDNYDKYRCLYDYIYTNKKFTGNDLDVIDDIYKRILSKMGFTSMIYDSLCDNIFDRDKDIVKIFTMCHINIFQKICKKYKLYEPVLDALGYDTSLLHKKLKYTKKDLV